MLVKVVYCFFARNKIHILLIAIIPTMTNYSINFNDENAMNRNILFACLI